VVTGSSSTARLKRLGIPVALLACHLLFAVPARADKIADAEDLFRRAKALMAQGKYEEACPMLNESYRSDPATGTLLNLALCNERIGKSASAWGEFRLVEQESRAATPPREDRVILAREHAEKLEPRLSRIKLVVSPAARAPGLVIKVDGEEKGEASWTVGIVVDPGTRLVEASAPHKKTATLKVKIDDEGVFQDVTLPPLADAPVEVVALGSNTADLARVEEYASSRARRTTGYVIGGIGLVIIGTGATFGVAAIINNNEAKNCGAPCYRGEAGAISSAQATDRALIFANIANVMVPLGVVAAGIGTYLLLTSGQRKISFAPSVSPRAASLDLSARW
jgi:hypothetical protein